MSEANAIEAKQKVGGKNTMKLMLSLAVPILAAAGVWMPTVQSDIGYSNSIVNDAAMYMYIAAAFVLAVNISADRLEPVVAKRLGVVSLIVLGGALAYSASAYTDGVEWIYNQTLYDATEPHWLYNDVDVDWQRIIALAIEDKAGYLAGLKVYFYIIPSGFISVLAALLLQACLVFASLGNAQNNSKGFSIEQFISIAAVIVAMGLALHNAPALSLATLGVGESTPVKKLASTSEGNAIQKLFTGFANAFAEGNSTAKKEPSKVSPPTQQGESASTLAPTPVKQKPRHTQPESVKPTDDSVTDDQAPDVSREDYKNLTNGIE